MRGSPSLSSSAFSAVKDVQGEEMFQDKDPLPAPTLRSMCRMRSPATYFMPLAMSRASFSTRALYASSEL